MDCVRPLYGALITVMLAALALACGGDDDGSPHASPAPSGAIATRTPAPEGTPTPRPTTTPLPTPSPVPEGGLHYEGFQIFGDFTYAEPIDFPEDLMILVETGCTQCDGPTQELYRVWRNSGETHVEHLIEAAISGSENAYITSFALRPDMSDIVVSVCTDCGGRGRPLTSSPVTLYRSRDGGLTWSSIHTTLAGTQVFVHAVTAKGVAVYDFGGENLRYLDGAEIESPEGAEAVHYSSQWTGELRWVAGEGREVLNDDGTTLAIVEPGGRIDSIAIRRDWRVPTPFVGWVEAASGPGFAGWNVTHTTTDYMQIGFNSDTFVAPIAILDDTSVLGRMSSNENPYGGTIGFIDISRGVLTPIHGVLLQEPFGNGEFPRGRNALVGAVEGPFLRVTTTTPCVEIRLETDMQSEVLTCAVDGVVVQDLESTITAGAQQWNRVRLLNGREGYAASEFLTAD